MRFVVRDHPRLAEAPDRHDAIVHQRLLPRGRSTIGSAQVAKLADASITRELATVDGRTREGDTIFSATSATAFVLARATNDRARGLLAHGARDLLARRLRSLLAP